MWLMLQQDQPDDYVKARARHTREGIHGGSLWLCGLDWRKYVEFDPKYVRPTEVDTLLADATKAREQLSWKPKLSFPELVRIMVDADMERPVCHLLGKDSDLTGAIL